MSWQISLLLFSAAFEVILLIAVRDRLRPALAGPFCLGLLLNAMWALNYALDLVSPSLEGKLWMLHIRSTFLPIYTVVWFETAFRFSLGRPLLRGRLLCAALVVPAVTAALCWLPGARDLLYQDPWIDASGPISLLRSTPGAWTPVYNFYNYLTGFAAIVVLFRMRPRERVERVSWMLFVSGAFLGLVADALYELDLSPTPGLNYAPILLPLSSGMMALALLGENLINVIPVARATVVDRLKEPLLVFDGYDRLVDLNPAAVATLALDSKRSLGRPAAEALAGWPQLHGLLRNPAPESTGEIKLGASIFEASLFNIETSGSSKPGARILALRDITLGKQAAAQLRLAKETAESASNAQSRFLAMMSHEIRTPMNGVVGFTQLLKDTPLNESQRDFLNMIDQSSRSLLVIINDVLDYSKIAADQLEIEQVPCDVGAIVAHAGRLLEAVATEKGITLRTNIASDVPPSVVSDPVRINQILTNLLGNALKFTETGGVTLDVSVPAPDFLQFTVTDTGIGIAPEQQARIFVPFSQADASTTRRFGGTGLGLSITRRLCELMGGSLTLRSQPGNGSVFIATISACAVNTSSIANAPASIMAADEVDIRSLELLVCEDNPVNQAVIRGFLVRLGHRPHIVEDGLKALNALATRSFDAVLMDLEMPVMDGYEAVRRIRAGETGEPRVYIIALTAHALKGERERCLALGMDDFLTKPVNLQILDDTLKRTPARPA